MCTIHQGLSVKVCNYKFLITSNYFSVLGVERMKAHNCMQTNELEAIYHLVESHVPSLRMKTVLRYEKMLVSASDNAQLSLCKNHVAATCTNTKIGDNVNLMLAKIREMPPGNLIQMIKFLLSFELICYRVDFGTINTTF
jgi:hypothetical protein